MGFLLPLPSLSKHGKWYNEIKFDDGEIPAFVRMVFDAAQMYACVGNAEGLEFCQRLAALLLLGHPTNSTLREILALNIQQKQFVRQRAEAN